MAKSKKGGMSKQAANRLASKTTRGGLSPDLYEALQCIPSVRHFDPPLGPNTRQDLETRLENANVRVHRTQRSLDFQQQIIDRIGTFSTYYDRASFVRENLSQHLAILNQLVTKIKHDLATDDFNISEQLAHELQLSEIAEHRQIFGRLDLPGNPDRPGPAPPRGLRSRSVNVPTPRKWYQPSTSAAATQQVSHEEPPLRRVPALRSPVTPSVLDQARIFTPVVKFKKCAHRRLHRLVSPADMKAMKLLLKKSCENVCGKTADPDTCTLATPPQQKTKPVKMSSLEDSSPLLEEVVEVPAANVPVVIDLADSDSSSDEAPKEPSKKSSVKMNNSSVPGSEVLSPGDPDWPIQVDGLDAENILNLSTEPEDNGQALIPDSPFVSNLEITEDGSNNDSNAQPRAPRSPTYPNLESPRFVTPPEIWGRATPCSCPNNFRLGYCFCPDKMDDTTEWISMGCSPFHSSLFESSLDDDNPSDVPDSDEDAFGL